MRVSIAIPGCCVLLGNPSVLLAGMPNPLPTNWKERILELNDSALHRLQAISFFLFVILLSSAVVRLLWNRLQRDFPALPHLTMGSALACVLLWGLLFVVVLAMISALRTDDAGA